MSFDWMQYPVTVLPLVAQARLQALDDAVVAGVGGGGLAEPERLTRAATAAAALSGQRVVTPTSGGTVRYALAADLADAHAPLWLTLTAASSGAPVDVVLYGPVTEPSWSWTRGPLWLTGSGQLTQTPPAAPSAAFSAVVGYATSATSVLIDRQPSITLL